MRSVILRCAPKLALLFGVLITLIRATPYDNSALRAFLAPPSDCAAPCWYGIRPGQTTIRQAVALIQRHPWINQAPKLIWFSSPAVSSFSWPWNGQEPAFIDRKRPGGMITRRNVVQIVRIPTTIMMGDLWLARPETAAPAGRCGDYVLDFYDLGFRIQTEILCPFRPSSFWRMPIMLYYLDTGDENTNRQG